MNWLKTFLKSKISITIVQPVEGVNHSFEPKPIEKKESPYIKRSKHSNFRFVQQDNTNGKIYYFTEQFEDRRWKYIPQSFSGNKNEAMDYYCKLIGGEEIIQKDHVETILWEGLSKEEAEMWTALHKT